MATAGDDTGAPRAAESDQVARHYWSKHGESSIEEMGVAPIGECGLTEVLYRHHEEVRHITRLASFGAGTDVLELGAGNGRWVLALGPLVKSYTAVDFSKAMLDVARKRVAQHGLRNVTFHEAPAQSYVPEQSFDVIYLSGVSQYIQSDDLAQLLGRLKQYLKPGGVLIDRSTIHLHRHSVADDSQYFSVYRTAGELIELYERAGWSNHYRGASYRFLSFPNPVKRGLRRRSSAWLVRVTAPISYRVLRASALLASFLFEPVGDARDYSHDFFVFRPKAA